MKRAFFYRDGASHKFWHIDYGGCDFSVNYGKAGAIGKFEIRQFDSAQACAGEAEKRIRAKIRAGYHEDAAFDFAACLYFDDPEYGPHPKTSHPYFNAHFPDDFYLDCTDEEAPFGSDEGADTLDVLEQALRKDRALDFAAFPQRLIEREWGMTYIPATSSGSEQDTLQSDLVTYAAAFAQIKMMGRLDTGLKTAALAALQRFVRVVNGEPSERQSKMLADLQRFLPPGGLLEPV